MSDRVQGKIAGGPEDQAHETDEEESSKGHDAIDHFLLGNEVHEISGDQEGFAASDEQRHADIHRPMTERNIGRQDRDDGAKQQRVENEQITAHVMAEMIRRMWVARGVCLVTVHW